MTVRCTQTSRERLESALARIADPNGEGVRTFLTLYADHARAAADASDARTQAGRVLGPLDGAIVSIKDLFDVAGEPTRAGSLVLARAAPALADAPVVRRLREAGAVIVGKTNMTEFAFSGVGANPHYGTPGNPMDRTCIPGGSTSGGAVAAADAMCEIAIGTDTGGSTRIPAALCGLVGFKPTKRRVSTVGVFPLSPSFDSVGPMACSIEACAQADAVLAGDEPWTIERASLRGLRFGIPQGFPLQGLDATVGTRFAKAIEDIGRNGVHLSDDRFPLFDDMARINSPVSISQVEAFAAHENRMAAHGAEYDPNVRTRIEGGRAVSGAAYAIMIRDRDALVRAMDDRLAELDALVLPTTPIVAPTLAEISTAAGFTDKNRLLLRNTAFANFFDLCSISLPLHPGNGPATGLMLVARNGQDRRLFQMAAAIKPLIA